MPNYTRAEAKSLRELNLDEKWLQERLLEDPSILGLGEVSIIERERSQPSGGRLDFLMSDPEEGIRYEVEVMLGRLDESHIIRTIEYWDIERTRFPQLEHRAVIVAEDITNRFFNIISLLNRAVPIIAIQMGALQIGENFSLNFTKVLDISELYAEEEASPGEQVDRAFWEKASNPASIAVVDNVLRLMQEIGASPRVSYNKYHIALGTSGKHFAWFHPRKNASHCHMHLRLGGEDRTEWVQKLDEAGIFAGPRGNEMKMRLTQREFEEHKELIRGLFAKAEELSRQ
jgi:hypothetical protein